MYDDEAFDAVVAVVRAQLAGGISLADTKQLVHTSPTWTDQREAAEALQEQLYLALDQIASQSEVQQ